MMSIEQIEKYKSLADVAAEIEKLGKYQKVVDKAFKDINEQEKELMTNTPSHKKILTFGGLLCAYYDVNCSLGKLSKCIERFLDENYSGYNTSAISPPARKHN